MIKPTSYLWNDVLAEEYKKPYWKELTSFLDRERRNKYVYPGELQTFRALDLCSLNTVKVVILGQDPYHIPGHSNLGIANGLAFSADVKNEDIPPSLKNIHRALKVDTGVDRQMADLSSWAKQGVMLLNSVLTVERGKPGSHKGRGWEQFTDSVIEVISKLHRPVVFCLWGREAQRKKSLLELNPNHLVLESSHPNPVSALQGFLWCKHFSKTNKFLIDNGEKPINWSL